MADRFLEFCMDPIIAKEIIIKAIRENDFEIFSLFRSDLYDIVHIITCTNVDIIRHVLKNVGVNDAKNMFSNAITNENITLIREMYNIYGASVIGINTLYDAVYSCNVNIVNFLIYGVGLQFDPTLDYYQEIYDWGKSYDPRRKYMFHLLMMHGAIIHDMPTMIDSLTYINLFEIVDLFINDVSQNALKDIFQEKYISRDHKHIIYLAERRLRFRLGEILEWYEYVRYNSRIYYALTDEQRKDIVTVHPEYTFDATWPTKATWPYRPMVSYYDIIITTSAEN